jgi:hypothetical protein
VELQEVYTDLGILEKQSVCKNLAEVFWLVEDQNAQGAVHQNFLFVCFCITKSLSREPSLLKVNYCMG